MFKIAIRTAVRTAVAMPVLALFVAMGRENTHFKKALLTIRFDDAYETQLPALDLLSSMGIRATLYAITGYIETPSYMTWNDLGQLNTQGHEIGSHSESHQSMLFMTKASLEKQLLKSREMLEKNGIRPVSFAWPYGLKNLWHSDIVKKYYRSAVDYPLLGGGGLNYKYSNPYDVKCVVVHKVDEFEVLMKHATKSGAWIVVCFHRINGSGRFSTNLEEFSKMMKLAADYHEKGLVDIVTVSEGIGRLEKRQE